MPKPPRSPTPPAGRPPELLHPQDLPIDVGPYRVWALLGEGGAARVFLADGPDGRLVALKIVRESRSVQRRKIISALKYEARLGRSLSHPNVVRTLAVGELCQRPVIALEYVDGVTLHRLLRAAGPLPPGAAVEVATQTARGLHAIHTAANEGRPLGLVHRDLKPSNLMIGRDGVVKIMDFGVAKARGASWRGATTEGGRVKGTPMYMSPEQGQGFELDGRSDLFAFGAMVLEATTGQRLFTGRSVGVVMMKIMSVDTVLARHEGFARLVDSQPRLAGLVARCLAFNPAHRPASAAEVADELDELRPYLSGAADLVGRVHVSARARPLYERPLRRPPGDSDGWPLAGAAPPPTGPVDDLADPDLAFLDELPTPTPTPPLPLAAGG